MMDHQINPSCRPPRESEFSSPEDTTLLSHSTIPPFSPPRHDRDQSTRADAATASAPTMVEEDAEPLEVPPEKNNENDYCNETPATKAVRISEQHNVYYDNPLSCTAVERSNDTVVEDASRLWYTVHEYQRFRSTQNVLAREIHYLEGSRGCSGTINRGMHNSWDEGCGSMLSRVHTTSYYKALLQTYAACCEAEDEFDSDDHDEEEEEMKQSHSMDSNENYPPNRQGLVLNPTEEGILSQWLEKNVHRHGLSSWAVMPVTRDRLSRRQQLLQAILEIQSNPILSSSLASSWYFSPTDKAELIRRTCRSISRPSRLFARQLAQAQQTPLDGRLV